MHNYLYIANSWSLTPGVRRKPKLPAQRVGQNGRPVFDENRGYDGPDRITAIMWITADCNVKDAITNLQMELEGEKLQIRWKPAQKKNSRNQICIYGLVPGFDVRGIMQELKYGLKESKKELCDGKKFTISKNIDHCDRPLPLLNGFFKQATAPKASSTSERKETLLNKNKEYMENGCRVFHLEYNPADNARMGDVWNHFTASGRSN
jgi:hypothetical protein